MRLVVRSASTKPEGGKIMYNEKPYRTPYKNPIGGIAVGILIIGLAVAIYLGVPNWTWFLTILFVGLALSALIGGFSSYDPKAAYGGLQGFVWLLGLALCFAIGFWPWILLPLGVSIILGALAVPIMESMRRSVFPPAESATNYPPAVPAWPARTRTNRDSLVSHTNPTSLVSLCPRSQFNPAKHPQPVVQPQEQAPGASQESEPQPVQQP